jgi:hypothetical protein
MAGIHHVEGIAMLAVPKESVAAQRHEPATAQQGILHLLTNPTR